MYNKVNKPKIWIMNKIINRKSKIIIQTIIKISNKVQITKKINIFMS